MALLVSSTLFSMFSNKLSASSLPFAKTSTSARDARRSLFMTSVKSGVAGTPRASGLWPNVGRAGFRCIVVACSLFAAVVVFPSGRPRVLLLLFSNCPFASIMFRKASSSGRRAFSSSPSSFLRVFPPRDDAISLFLSFTSSLEEGFVVVVVLVVGSRHRCLPRSPFLSNSNDASFTSSSEEEEDKEEEEEEEEDFITVLVLVKGLD